MAKTLKLFFLSIVACTIQTSMIGYFQLNGIAPDCMAAVLSCLGCYVGGYGGFCTGAIMALLYDASVGYILALNMVIYTVMGCASPEMYKIMGERIRNEKVHHLMTPCILCCIMVMLKEIVNFGYLFLIGSQVMNIQALYRILISSIYSAAITIPLKFLTDGIMRYHMRTKTTG